MASTVRKTEVYCLRALIKLSTPVVTLTTRSAAVYANDEGTVTKLNLADDVSVG